MTIINGKDLGSFSLYGHDGINYQFPQSLSKEGYTVFYFYPQDDTPGCTKQATSFRDSLEDLKKYKVEVYGVSKDSVESHKKFHDKYNLNFTLLSDPDGILYNLCEIQGRDLVFVESNGKVASKWMGVSPSRSVEDCLDTVRDYHNFIYDL